VRLRFGAISLLLVAILIAATGRICLGQEEEVPREHHVWGRFLPGAWKTVRIVTETFGPDSQVKSTSVADIKTTLTDADLDYYTLWIESTAAVAGKRIVSQPQVVSQRYNGATPGQIVQGRSLGNGRVTIDGAEYPCEVRQYEVTGDVSRTTTTVHYSSRTVPYVLERKSDSVDLATGAVTGRTTMQVVALDMPYKVLEQTCSSTHFKCVSQHDKGTTITLTISALDVPGAVVSQTTKELDARGRLVRRSTLELVDYGAIHVDDRDARRPRLFRRHRGRAGHPRRSEPRDTPAPLDLGG
jgi:hypothetical protein